MSKVFLNHKGGSLILLNYIIQADLRVPHHEEVVLPLENGVAPDVEAGQILNLQFERVEHLLVVLRIQVARLDRLFEEVASVLLVVRV